VASAFTVRRVEALRPRVAAIVDELIGAFTARPQPADLLTSFSLPLLVRVICELLGVPADDMDPGLIRGAVEELVRYVRIGVLPLARLTTEDVELGAVMIPAGEVVLPTLQAANRDPSVFSEPESLHVTRSRASHLGFGSGAHHCLGAQLARVELQEALCGLVRLPGLAVAVPASDLRFKPGMAIHNLRAAHHVDRHVVLPGGSALLITQRHQMVR
jgi:cytochrome P450